MQSARYFCLILTKFGISRQIFIKVPKVEFQGNPSSGNQAERQKEEWSGRHGESDQGPSGTMRTRVKIRSVEVALFCGYRRTDITRLSVALCNCFANMSKIKRCAINTSYGQHSLLLGNPRL